MLLNHPFRGKTQNKEFRGGFRCCKVCGIIIGNPVTRKQFDEVAWERDELERELIRMKSEAKN